MRDYPWSGNTPRRVDSPTGLSPADTQLAAQMEQTPLRLTRRADMWRCWIGFNYSHSLGMIWLGAVAVIVGSSEPLFRSAGPILVPAAFLASAMYLLLAAKYWFRTPIVSCAVCCLLFLASWILLP